MRPMDERSDLDLLLVALAIAAAAFALMVIGHLTVGWP